METIKINSVEKKMSKNNKPYWSIDYNNGEKTSVWDETIGGYLTQKIGQNVSVEFKINGQYKNLIGCDFTTSNLPDIPIMPSAPKEANVGINSGLLDVRSASIVAQVILKEANNNISANIQAGLEMDTSKYGEWLCENVTELAAAYNVAFSILNG